MHCDHQTIAHKQNKINIEKNKSILVARKSNLCYIY